MGTKVIRIGGDGDKGIVGEMNRIKRRPIIFRTCNHHLLLIYGSLCAVFPDRNMDIF